MRRMVQWAVGRECGAVAVRRGCNEKCGMTDLAVDSEEDGAVGSK